MVDLELYESDVVITEYIRYCFIHLLREDLNSVTNDWNTRIISKSRNCGPRGRSDSMFFLPNLFNASDYSVEIDLDEIDAFSPIVAVEEDCSPDFK